MSEKTKKMTHHLPRMMEGMNNCLDEAKLTPSTPEGLKKSNTQRRQAFLQLAIENFDWDESTVNDTSWDDEGIAGRELTQDNSIEESIYREYYERKDAHQAYYKPALNAYLEIYRERRLPRLGKIIANANYDWELVFDEIAKAIRREYS